MRDEEKVKETDEGNEYDAEHQGKGDQIFAHMLDGLAEERQTPMEAAKAQAFQVGKETAERKRTSSELIEVDRSLQIDVGIAMGRGKETSDPFFFFIFPDQHSNT